MSETCFLSQITLHTVGQLQNCAIALSTTERQHLILTGRNGSGKTVVLQTVREALWADAESVQAASALTLTFSQPECWQALRRANACLLAYYPTSFRIIFKIPEDSSPFDLPTACAPDDRPGEWFLPYLVKMYAEQALARQAVRPEMAQPFDAWLMPMNQALQELFQDPTLALQVHQSPWRFTLYSRQSAARDLTRLSEGHNRLLSIFCDLLMRLECLKTADRDYHCPGIVLIDGLEHNLHIEVQKRILPVFTTIFPNLQFLVSTHSPFIMNSLESAVVFDLDRHARINDVLTSPYEALIERYDLRKYSDQVRQLLGEYESLLNKKLKTEQEEFRLLELGNYLAWVLTKFRKEHRTIDN